MTGPTKALIEYLRKIELELDDDWLRQMVQNSAQAVIELEAEKQIGRAGTSARRRARPQLFSSEVFWNPFHTSRCKAI